jgi:hypothetical protein
MYWGAAKRYVRQHCNYTWKGLQENVPKAFDSISLKQIRKYARRATRFMECYRKGLTVLQAEYIVKKYKSHRRIPDNVINEIDELNKLVRATLHQKKFDINFVIKVIKKNSKFFCKFETFCAVFDVL